jgi:hypothetical protein
MSRLRRRDLLAGVTAAGALALGGCLDLSAGTRVLDRTVTPGTDGNPATIAVDVDPGTVLTIETAAEQPAVFDLFHADSGVSLATGGAGLVYDQSPPVRSDPLPDSENQNALVVAMAPDDAVDVRISRAGESRPRTPADPGQRLREEIAIVSDRIHPGVEADDLAAVGPLWLWLLAEKLAGVPARIDTEPAQAELTAASEAVYGSLLRQRLDAWVQRHVVALASDLASATVAAVSARTDTPAERVETLLQTRLEAVLTGDATWSDGEPAAENLHPTGGTLAITATATLDFAFEDADLTVGAPVRFSGSADGDSVPASAEIRAFDVRAEQVSVE